MVKHDTAFKRNWQQQLWERYPGGLGVVAGERVVVHNRVFGELIGEGDRSLVGTSYHEYFAALTARSRDADRVQRELEEAVSSLAGDPRAAVDLDLEGLRHWRMLLVPLPGAEGGERSWACLLDEISPDQNRLEFLRYWFQRTFRETRLPLASLQGSLASLLSGYDHWDPELGREFLRSMREDLQKVWTGVDRGMTLFQLESGSGHFQTRVIDLQRLLDEFRADLEGEEGIDYQFTGLEKELYVRIDPARVRDAIKLLLRAVREGRQQSLVVNVTAEKDHNQVYVRFDFQEHRLTPREARIFSAAPESSCLEEEDDLNDMCFFRTTIAAHGGKCWLEEPRSDPAGGSQLIFALPRMLLPAGKGELPSPGNLLENPPRGTILVVDHRPEAQSHLRSVLSVLDNPLNTAPDGRTTLDRIAVSPPDLVLISSFLPDMDGLSLIRAIRRWSSLPIILLSDRPGGEDLAAAFQAGADDYLAVPFQSTELIVRVQARLKGSSPDQTAVDEDTFAANGLRIHYRTREVWARGKLVELTPIEYRILDYMSRHTRQVLTYQQMIQNVWDTPEAGSRQGLFTHISRLRDKIEAHPEESGWIQTRWGVGYVFMPEVKKTV